MNSDTKIPSFKQLTIESATDNRPTELKSVSFSESYIHARDAVVKSGLPLLFVERNLSPQAVLREPVVEYFPNHLRGIFSEKSNLEELDANNFLMDNTDQVFVESKRFSKPVFVSNLGDLARRSPGMDIFLHSIIHWPKFIHKRQVDEDIIFTAALFQSGFFLPKDTDYARYVLAEVFPLFAKSDLQQAFAEALSFAVLDPYHLSIAEAILDLGADPNRPSHEGFSPLNEALMRSNKEAAKLLLKRGANLLPDMGAESPLENLHEGFDREKDRDLFEAFEQASQAADLSPADLSKV